MAKKNDNWNFWIWFFCPQNGCFVTQNCFPKNGLLKPPFLLCFLGARFLAKLSKKGKFWTPTKRKEKLTDN